MPAHSLLPAAHCLLHTACYTLRSNRLGLPVSAYLAELMGGSLVFDPGVSAFVLTVPLQAPVANAAAELSSAALLAAILGG